MTSAWPGHLNRDWYWNQFDPTIKDGGLDFSDDQTIGISDLADHHRLRYETDFIDELYGTEERAWENRKGEALDPGGPTQEMYSGRRFMTNEAEVRRMGDTRGGMNADSHVLWGLDLRRVDNDALKVGTVEHYQHMTRGEVDWSSYQKDSRYIKAFNDMQKDSSEVVRNISSIGFLTNTNRSGKHSFTDKQRVDFIRAANEMIGEEKGEGREKPEGEYNADRIKTERDEDGTLQLYMSGERQERLTELYNTRDEHGEKKGRLAVGFTYTRKDEDGNNVEVTVGDRGELGESAFDPVSGPPTPVVKPDIKVPNIQVKVPPGLQQWKDLAKQTLKVGGKK